MKGSITLEVPRVSNNAPTAVIAHGGFTELSAAEAALLIFELCNALRLTFRQRAIILHAIAAGALDDPHEVRRGAS